MSLVVRRCWATGVVIAGLAIGLWGCSSQALDQTAPMDGGSGAGGSDAAGRGAGGSSAGTYVALFDTDTEGFAFDPYHDPSATNLADPANAATPPPTLTFDATQGSPSPGSLQITAPFSGANQYVKILKNLDVSAPLDWSGEILHVRVKVTQGTFNGIVQPFVYTLPSYVFGGTAVQVATGSDWQEVTLNLSNPMTRNVGYDPAQVLFFGVQLNTGSAGAGATPVVFNIDSFSVSP